MGLLLLVILTIIIVADVLAQWISCGGALVNEKLFQFFAVVQQ
jgi:hypothetical protein